MPNNVAATDNRATPIIACVFTYLVNKADFLNEAIKERNCVSLADYT